MSAPPGVWAMSHYSADATGWMVRFESPTITARAEDRRTLWWSGPAGWLFDASVVGTLAMGAVWTDRGEAEAALATEFGRPGKWRRAGAGDRRRTRRPARALTLHLSPSGL